MRRSESSDEAESCGARARCATTCTCARAAGRIGEAVTKILIVEDDVASAYAIGDVLELQGFEVHRAFSVSDAMESARTFTPDAVLVDLTMPMEDGRSFVELYRRSVRPAASVIVMSDRVDGRTLARSLGADAFVPKPIEVAELLRAIALTLAAA